MDKLYDMMDEMPFPSAYDHFAEGESPEPPFITYLCPGSDNFFADGKVYLLSIVVMLLVEWVQRSKRHGLDLSGIKYGAVRYAAYLAALFLIFALGGQAENFIYFQF